MMWPGMNGLVATLFSTRMNNTRRTGLMARGMMQARALQLSLLPKSMPKRKLVMVPMMSMPPR